MGKTYLICPDSHSHPDYDNARANWLGELIMDIKPDVFVHLGDGADMASLSSYDKGKRSFQGRNYKDDINSHLDFQDRLWDRLKRSKKRQPETIYLIGNHEQRIDRALDLSPELEGTIGYKDLNLEYWYDHVIHYDGNLPGVFEKDGILFAHYLPTGISGRPLGGENPASAHRIKVGKPTVTGHTHIFDFASRNNIAGNQISNVIAGCFLQYTPEWAGPLGKLWWRGVVILDDVEDGQFDLRTISLNKLEKVYSQT